MGKIKNERLLRERKIELEQKRLEKVFQNQRDNRKG